MSHGVTDLLIRLKESIEESFTIPLASDKCFLDKDKAIGLLDEAIANLPGEMSRAVRIVEKQQEILKNAKREAEMVLGGAKKEAEGIVAAAEERARRMVSEDEILRQARRKAAELESQTRENTREVLRATNEYVDRLLIDTETAIKAALSVVHERRADMKNKR